MSETSRMLGVRALVSERESRNRASTADTEMPRERFASRSKRGLPSEASVGLATRRLVSARMHVMPLVDTLAAVPVRAAAIW